MVGTPDGDSWATLPRRLDRRTAAWLVDAVAPGSRRGSWSPGQGVPEGLLTAAQIHGVEGWVRQRALTSGVVLDGVDVAVHAVLGRHQRALVDLGLAHGALTAAAVRFLVVKGPAVTRWYAEPSLRSYVDLDVVVAPEDLGGALDALEGAGFTLLDANWPFLLDADVHELVLRTPSGGALDLHWSLGPSPMSIDRSPAFGVLHGRSVEFDAGPVAVRGLGDADAVVHLAVHAAASGGHRLVWLTDLRAAITATAPDAAVLGRVADEWGARPALDLMLGRLRRVTGDARSQSYQDGSWHPWSLVDGAVTWVSPPERTATGGSLSRLVARSSRQTSAASLAALGWKSLSRTAGALTRSAGSGGDLSPAQRADPTSPTSARRPVGGAAGRSEFVRRVRERRR
ncbi:nucleotidyltransferase family protein [Pedococcus bigeumensis]|uniref:Uncharacterized protein n=1 Tax=Pedococcus bigeumensis TaxID=433644 RepID=A0A502D1C6_9MICO|nr:nucleotidyltransferase family protein [Pedococcus bigeumensis]TPG18968.1 hypothetical protein EAH86_00040 [Pedococcus bigeumensis]